ncbi:MAG: sulfatase-like hydrolase/transferase [Candidatus Micrarchaeia archaeon]
MKHEKPNIAIILLDAVRFDSFYKVVESKRINLEGFAHVEKCIAPASWTLPSHASLFTGMYPSEHGAHETKEIKALDIDEIKLRKATIVEDLKAFGYKAYGISANPYIHPLYGFTGFDSFVEETYFTDMQGHTIEVPKKLKPLLARYREQYGGSFFKIGFAMLRDDPALITEIVGLPETGFLTLKNIAKRIKAKVIEGWPVEKGGKNALTNFVKFRPRQPFFFFLNLMEAHEPYVGKKGMDFDWPTPFLKKQPSRELVELWKKKYMIGVGKAIDYALNLYKYIISKYRNTIVIITSDHGQEFGEHNFIGHGVRLDDELVRVPFIIHLPDWMEYKKSSMYASLVNVRRFLNLAAKGEAESMKELYSKMVYAESFGVQSNMLKNAKLLGSINLEKLRKLDKYQKRVFNS